ncbi:hypothetical protein KEM52_006589 [Ascosphaera acerosa]|nr:hypothetical protein KEM52_006589 [Ascosphaera acerosa]
MAIASGADDDILPSPHTMPDRPRVASPEPIAEEDTFLREGEVDDERSHYGQHEGRLKPSGQHIQLADEALLSVPAMQDRDMSAPNAESVVLARSLASVDSEASWFSSKVSRSLSAKTARTQAQIDRYRAQAERSSPRDADFPTRKSSTRSRANVTGDDNDDADDEFQDASDIPLQQRSKSSEHRKAKSADHISVRAGASNMGRLVVNPSSSHRLMAHASTAEFGDTDNCDADDEDEEAGGYGTGSSTSLGRPLPPLQVVRRRQKS